MSDTARSRTQAAAGSSLLPGASEPTGEGSHARGAMAARLPRSDRLRARRDFLRVQSQGRRVHTPHFILLVLPDGRQRLGVTVTRKLGGAVERNRVKRLLREAFRQDRDCFPANCAVVAVARAGAGKLDYAAVRAELDAARPLLLRAAEAASQPRSSRKTAP